MSTDLDRFELFPWNTNFEIGISVIDEQHKVLVQLLNKLSNTLVQKEMVDPESVFDEMFAYTKYHFQTEEKIWTQAFGDDEWLNTHRKTHASFIPSIRKLKKQLHDMPLQEATEGIVKFLIQWLAHHIIDSDKRMALVLEKVMQGAGLDEAKRYSELEMSDSAQVLMNSIFIMYDVLSSRTLALMRERDQRKDTELKLKQANLELEQMAITDQLTGLYNRRYFNSIFERELGRARRDKHVLSLIMFDIDYFKQLNDQYGHLQGDAALRKLGEELLLACNRSGDFAFRYGGEEFAVLVTDQTVQGSVDFAERIRAEIERLDIINESSEVSKYMTVSVGVVARIPDHTDSLENFVRDVDARLYMAKSSGRNRVVLSS